MENKIQKQNSTRIQLELNLGEQLNAGRIKKRWHSVSKIPTL